MGILKDLMNKIFGSSNTTTIKPVEDTFIPYHDDMLRVVHVNPNVYLANRGARICIGKLPIEGDNEARMKYIEKVARRGHESVMEHTNAIVILSIPNHNISLYPADFADILAQAKYCNVSVRESVDATALLIGGSARAWLHLLREVKYDNRFLPWIEEAMYHTYEKCFLISAIEHCYLAEDKCTYLGDGDIKLTKDEITQVKNPRESKDSTDNYTAECEYTDPEEIEGERVDLVYQSPLKKIRDILYEYGFGLNDTYKVATLTFRFHDISRTCSHQLVRHRNGISQESQRYVTHDYNKKVDFVDPIIMNYSERYKDHPYFGYVREKIKENDPFIMYKYLISNKITKEDARAWLPSNVTTQLLMTMTYTNWAKFLQLRCHSSAQKEIRLAANETMDLVIHNDEDREKFINYAADARRGDIPKKDTDPLMFEVDIDNVDEEVVVNPEPIKVDNLEDAGKLIQQNENLK